MAKALSLRIERKRTRDAQLGEAFLSSKHQDYLAAIAEFTSGVRG